MPSSISSGVTVSGGMNRTAFGPDSIEQDSGLVGIGQHLARNVAVKLQGSEQSLAPHIGDEGKPGLEAVEPVQQVGLHPLDVGAECRCR